MDQKCPICNSDASVKKLGALEIDTEVTCPVCGHFVITDDVESKLDDNRNMIASWLYYHAEYDDSRCISVFKIYDGKIEKSDARYVSLEQIANWYPRTFIERADQFIMFLAKVREKVGDIIRLSGKHAVSACFGKHVICRQGEISSSGDASQYPIFVSRLVEMGYLTPESTYNQVVLSAKGWIRVDELTKNNPNNRNVFIAMAFPKKDDTTSELAEIKESIISGILQAGYNPIIMSDIIHGKQIVPMMFRLIRESKLLVMDVTVPNYGAYHEAGYALGLDKEVIITCREKEFNDPKNKPHFDIAQKQILVWEDYEDLVLRLSEWIKAIAK